VKALDFFAPLGAGLVFALGLAIGGMTQPGVVIGFLDFAGDWNPRLVLVMAGAIAVYLPLHRLVTKRSGPVLGGRFSIPSRRDIDLRLLAGAAIFGIGWGTAGFCPGPGIASLATGAAPAIVFVVSMLGGMLLFKGVDKAWSAHQASRRTIESVDPPPVGPARALRTVSR